MRCTEARSFLSAFIDAELGRSESEAVRAHLVDCASCRAAASDLRSLSRFFAAEDPAPRVSPGFTDAVLSRLRAGEGVAERRAERTVFRVILAAAAVLVLSVGYLAAPASLWTRRSPDLEAGSRHEVEKEIRANDAAAMPIEARPARRAASRPSTR